MIYTDEHTARLQRAMQWYAPARLGLFYHWGLYSGGGSLEDNTPFAFPTVEAFERAMPDPRQVAKNMVSTATRCGAKYIVLTLLHGGDGYFLKYPSKLRVVRNQATLDYVGAFIETALAANVKPMFYIPANACFPDWVREDARSNAGFAHFMESMVDEMVERYGTKIAGFWIDGMTPEFKHIPAYIHERLPEAIVVNNNCTSLDVPSVDYGTTEFVNRGFEPAYCRPHGLARRVQRCGISIPGRNFNEDIPTCNLWWHKGDLDLECASAQPYLNDPAFLVKQVVSSLGQRGQWNFAWGLGPCADGTAPACFQPSIDALGKFMAWGAEAIHNTTGGEGSQLTPGYFTAPWTLEGFCSITRRLDAPGTYYVLVTDAPDCDAAMFHSDGAVPRRVTDLRTGAELPFTMVAGIHLRNVDWSDVQTYGVKVFKVEF